MSLVFDSVFLRRPEPKDVERLYAYRNDWDVVRFLGGFSSGYSVRDLEEWIEFHRNKADEIIWIIAERETDYCLGHVGLYNLDHRARKAEFAILIGEKTWWNKGIGQLVTRAVVDYGFDQLNLHRIELSVLETNVRAIHIYEKLGFRREAILRDAQFRDGCYVNVVMMAILEQEHRSRG